MGEVFIKLEVFPEAPETDMEKVAEEVVKIIEKNKGKVVSYKIEPFVFGLKKLIIVFMYPEQEFNEEALIEEIQKVEGVQSAEVTEVTRNVF